MEYTKMKVVELKQLCKKHNLKGYSKLKKQELISLLKENSIKLGYNNLSQNMDNSKTFKDLYTFLQNFEENNILNWLETPWVGKEKQESLLRLFAGLGLIDKLKSFTVCKGNYNQKTIEKHNCIKDLFYHENNELKNLKDKGDSSDLTCINNENEKELLVTTSKNINKMQIAKLEIDKILTYFEQYKTENYLMTLCICIRSIVDYENMKKGIEKTNKELKNILEKESTIIIDWKDLNEAYIQFKTHFVEKPFADIINNNKKTLTLKMHQELSVYKTLELKNNNKNKILWGHIQRSGKSYIMCGCIIEDSKNKTQCNYLVITTSPNETIMQQREVFDCNQLNDFNIILLNGKNKKPDLKNKNIIICSKQFLQTKIDKIGEKEKTKSINWLKSMKFDMRFIDESHNGGSTELAQQTLEYYGKLSFTVQITATYSKPINDYNIPKDCWILWDLEDIKLCKTLNENSINRLVEKHGSIIEEIIHKYSKENLLNTYNNYPELMLLTEELKEDCLNTIIDKTRNNSYGWSCDACFLLKQGLNKTNEKIISNDFQNESENLKLWYKIFGKYDEFGIPDDEYPDSIVFMKRIEKICKNPTINSRFIGEGDYQNEPMIIMAFLPQNNIDKISKATIKLLEKYNVIPDYEIISINSKTTSNPKVYIEEARIKAKNSNKKGVLVLSGRQCSLGVSIRNCDIVLLLNNNTGFDMIYQMMFRCMTESKDKKCGFVVDLNIHRVIETSLINYASLIKPESHPKDATQYILQERLINLNADHWMPTFGNNNLKLNSLVKNVYEVYSSNTENALNHYLNRLRFKEVLLSNEEKKIFNVMFSNKTPTKVQKELIEKLIDNEEKIKKGIEKIELNNEEDKVLDEKESKEINYMDLLKHIIPLICLLTIHDEKTSFIEMFEFIENNEYIYNILIDQTKSWWSKSIDSKIIKNFINVYIKYMKDDKETNQIIRTIKELFVKNINNNKELSSLIDKYLIPQELEKKNNAEVSTPVKLRMEMLDKVPKEFWNKPRKVFEPCSGKGGFLIDIIDRFMDGLKEVIIDDKLRYKKIVEECLYFSDINRTNIFICKLLIDPYNEYKLNYNEGNTLEIDIKEKWDLDEFDAVIGNPPYNSSGNTGTGNTIWQDFTKVSLNKLLKKNGYLLYVHPPGWRKPNTKRGKFYGLYNLMTNENQMLYLSIHDIIDGKKTFNCGTRYDWYIIEKKKHYKKTIINDENNENIEIDISIFNWLPNSNIETINNLTNNKNKCDILCDFSYSRLDKKIVSVNKTEKFKYPLIYLTPSKGIRYMYSSVNNKGHFKIPKVIIGETGMDNAINDFKGEYGMTQDSFGIIIENEIEGNNILKAIKSDKFKNLIKKSCSWSNFRIDYRLFKDFNKNFWEEFI
jgi:hypothetical protein